MILQKMSDDVEIVQSLSTYPNQEDGLSAEELKAKFDQGPKALKNYLNNVLVPAVQEIQKALAAGEQYGLDTTLQVAGRAADAAAVGERFANMKAADIGAAPVGLVTKALSVADEAELDAALSAELAAMAENTAQFLVISPKSGALFGGVGMLCELYKRSASGYGTAKFTGYGSESPDVLYKTLWAGVWQPLEWENPPMLTGVEYRTTERWNGKEVYAKRIYFGYLPNGATVDVPHEISGKTWNVRYSIDTNQTNRLFDHCPEITSVYADSTNISISTDSDLSATAVYFTLWYTKS